MKEGGKKAWGEKMHRTAIPDTNLTGFFFLFLKVQKRE